MATESIGTAQLPLSNVDDAFKSVINKQLKLKNGMTVIIPMRDDGYINATVLAKASNKRIANWLRKDEVKELIEEFEIKLSHIEIVNPIVTIEGRNGGTYMHPDIAIQFAQWCNPKFALQVSRWTRELLLTGSVTLGQEKTQKELEEATKKLFEQAKVIEEKDKLITKYKDEILLFKSKYARLESNHRSMLYRREYYKFKCGLKIRYIHITNQKQMATTSFPTAQLPLFNTDDAFKSIIQQKLTLKSGNILIIPIREDGYINATVLAKASNKRIDNWLRKDEVKELIADIKRESPHIEETCITRGRYAGTYMHPDLGQQFAQHCSPTYARQVSRWIRELLLTGSVTLGHEKTLKELEEATKKLVEQTKEIEEKDKLVSKYRDESLLFQSKYARLESNHRAMLYRREYYKFKEGHCFYLVRDPNYEESKGICKFGISKNINQRLKQLRTTWPNLQISLLAFVDDEHVVRILEESIRKRYAGKRLLMEQNHEVLKGVDINKVIMRAKSFLKHVTHEIEQNIDKYNRQNMIADIEDVDHDTTVAETATVMTHHDLEEREDEDGDETVVGEGEEGEEEEESDGEIEVVNERSEQVQRDTGKETETNDTRQNQKRAEKIYNKVKVYGKDMHECKECKKQFVTQSSVYRHYREKHDPIMLKCTEPGCELEFYRKERLDEHVARIHNKRLFECTKCDKKFRQAKMLKLHVERDHEKVRHLCTYCSKEYTNYQVLKGHIESKHTKTSRHHCGDCNRFFPSSMNLRKHREKMHHISVR